MSFQESFIVSDGKQLLLKWGATDRYFFAESYYVRSLSVSSNFVDVTTYGNPAFQLKTGQTLDFEITSGSFKCIDNKEALQLFRTAESMSVNELLSLAYQKLNNRES